MIAPHQGRDASVLHSRPTRTHPSLEEFMQTMQRAHTREMAGKVQRVQSLVDRTNDVFNLAYATHDHDAVVRDLENFLETSDLSANALSQCKSLIADYQQPPQQPSEAIDQLINPQKPLSELRVKLAALLLNFDHDELFLY